MINVGDIADAVLIYHEECGDENSGVNLNVVKLKNGPLGGAIVTYCKSWSSYDQLEENFEYVDGLSRWAEEGKVIREAIDIFDRFKTNLEKKSQGNGE